MWAYWALWATVVLFGISQAAGRRLHKLEMDQLYQRMLVTEELITNLLDERQREADR